MSTEQGYSAERAKPFASDHWADDTPVVSDHHLEHNYPIPRFGDEDRWDLGALGWNPAAGRHSAVLLFNSFSGPWNLRARELAIAWLCQSVLAPE